MGVTSRAGLVTGRATALRGDPAGTRDFFRDAAANYHPQAFAEAFAAVADAPTEGTDLISDAEETPD